MANVGAHKKVTPNKKPSKPQRTHGEHWLDRIAALTLKLENGEKVTFDLAKEVSIPDVPLLGLQQLERNSAARYAFWSAQAARQRREVRKRKRALIKIEADADIIARKHVQEDTDYNVTERAVQSRVDLMRDVRLARTKLDDAEYQLELLEMVREAVRARSFSLGRLLNTTAAAAD